MRIIKVGGGASINLEGVVKDLAELAEPAVVVHGANALRDELAQLAPQTSGYLGLCCSACFQTRLRSTRS